MWGENMVKWFFNKKRFPTVPIIGLVVSILWLLKGLNIISIDLPWMAIILIVVFIGWIVNAYNIN